MSKSNEVVGDCSVSNLPFSPRDYQGVARVDVNVAINNKEHPLLVMPTGTGKSKTSASIIYDQIKLDSLIVKKRKKVVFVICPQEEIFNQLLKDYSFMNPGYINSEGLRGVNRQLYVCMALSLVNILNLLPPNMHPDIIITDECHHSKADSWEAIYNFFPSAVRFGMTATPVRTDGKPLGDLYTQIIEPITIKEALERGYLTAPIVITPEEFLQDIPTGEDIDEKKQAEILGDPRIIGEVIKVYERVLNGLPTLFACCSYKQARSTMEEFRKAGWNAEHIHGNLSKFDRKNMLDRVAKGEINCLFTVGVGIEGLDIPNLYALAWLRRTESTTIKVQLEGRPMRLMDGKKNSFILDFVGNCVIHGMPDRVRKWSLTEGDITEDEDLPDMQLCPDCGVYNHIDNINCHWCGADLTEEGKKEGTCRRCESWKKGKCIKHESFAPCFCPVWLKFEGCPEYLRRSRKLPIVEDGELIAVDMDGNTHDLNMRTQTKKEQIKKKQEQEKMESEKLESVSDFEKLSMIRKGIFVDGNRRNLFAEALRG